MSVDSPARPVSPDPPPRLADRAQGRPGRRGSPLALRNWPVTWRLIALIAIPTVVAMAFAGLRVAAAAGSAATFGRSAQLAALGQQVTGLAQAMEDERDLTAQFIADGRPTAGQPATVSLNTDALQPVLDEISKAVDQPPTNARFTWDGANLSVLRTSQAGRGLDQAAARDILSKQLLSGARGIDLPVVPVAPAVTSDDGGASLGIRELIESSTTSFVGSVAFPAIAVAAAGTPTQNLNEAMFTTSSGLTVSSGGAPATTAGAAADGSSSLSFVVGPLNR